MLKSVGLDGNGHCRACVYPTIPTQVLEYEKEKLRNRYEQEDAR